MTNEDVLKLAKAGFSDDLILATIAGATKSAFDLSPDGLVALKRSGVTEAVIGAMLRATTTEPSPAPVVSAEPIVIAPAPEPLRSSASVGPTPSEIGVYFQRGNQLIEIRPEIVQWRTGGFWKRMATAGIAGGHLNGWVSNQRSPNIATRPLQVLIYAAEGTSVTEYQLLRLDEKSTRREFRLVSTSIVGARSGADDHLIEYGAEKTAPRTYVLRLENLPLGEYGFLAPGTSASNLAANGKIYSFSVR